MSLGSGLRSRAAVGLAVALVVSGPLAWWNAAHLVEARIADALAVARQAIMHGLGDLPRQGGTRRELERLVATFEGDRILRVRLAVPAARDAATPTQTIAISTADAAVGRTPDRLRRLLGLDAGEAVRVPVTVDGVPGAILLEADGAGRTRATWSEFARSLLLLGLVGGETVLLIGWMAGRVPIRPLGRVSAALERIGEGDAGARAPLDGPPEVARLAAGINRMADRLASIEARSRSIEDALLTLQEAERAALARDLHDEIGPYLFAIKVDATAIARLATEQRSPEIAAQVALIEEAVDHMQRQVRATLGTLRPAALADLGLASAIEHLIAFWRTRHPATGVEASVGIPRAASGFGPAVDTAIYRLVQEALSNAIRHGHASHISIAIAKADGSVVVTVVDNGHGMAPAGDGAAGFGLIGMRERVAALGGTLSIRDGAVAGGVDRGLAVVARLPIPAHAPRAAEPSP